MSDLLFYYYLSIIMALSTGKLSFQFFNMERKKKHIIQNNLLVCSVVSGKTTVLMVGKDKDFTAALGESVTLECLIKSDIVAKYYWYKESVGYFPRLVSSLYTYDESKHFSNEFSNNPRFALDIKNGKIRLMISDLQLSDTATYYCAGSFSETLEFEDRITIIIKGSGLNIPVFIQRPEYYPSQSEGAVRLNCTTHGRIFDEEHGVYHLRTSGSPDPGFLYTWKNNTCFYSLPASSQAVDCAVATCAHILPRAPYEGETEGELVSSKKVNVRQSNIQSPA